MSHHNYFKILAPECVFLDIIASLIDNYSVFIKIIKFEKIRGKIKLIMIFIMVHFPLILLKYTVSLKKINNVLKP